MPIRSTIRTPERFGIAVIPDLHVASDAQCNDRLTPCIDWVLERQHVDRLVAVVNVGDGLITATQSTIDLYTAQVQRCWDAGLFYVEIPGNWNMGNVSDGTVPDRKNSFGLSYLIPTAMRAHPAWINNYVETDADDPTGTHLGVKDSIDNSAAILNIGAIDLMLLWCEYGPTATTMEWLTTLAERFPALPKIFITHSHGGIMVGSVTSWFQPLMSDVNSAQSPDAPTNEGLGTTAINAREVWRNYLIRWPNLIGTISGHVHLAGGPPQGYLGPDGTGKLVQAFDNGDFEQTFTNWNLITPWSATTHALVKPSNSTNVVSRISSELVRGARYRVRCDIIAYTSGAVRFQLGTTYGRWWRGLQTTDEWIECDTPIGNPDTGADRVGKFKIEPTNDFIGTLDNILCETEGQEQPDGNPVFNITCNYQSSNPNNASMRLLDFRPSDGLVFVKTFDTKNRVWRSDVREQFTMAMPQLALRAG